MSETKTARALVFALQNAAFACGEDNRTEHVSNARLNKNDDRCREAEKEITDRIEQLERELAAANAEKAEAVRRYERAELAADFDRLNKLEAELVAMTAERDEAVRKQAIDQAQCDWATSEAARLASELAAAKAAIDRVRLNFEWSTILTEREWKLIAKELCKAPEVKP